MAAPKGNKFAVGNSGRSKLFESVEELSNKLDAYFEKCDENVLRVDAQGNNITEPYTIEGIALELGCDRDTLLNYEKAKGYEEFFGSIKEAKLKVQKQKVINMLVGLSNSTGSIFDLKNNHGYKDKTETISTVTNLTPPTPEELKKASEDLDETI